MKQWIEALKEANNQEAFTDRLKRRCKETPNLSITFSEGYEQPLKTVRGFGWVYPSNDELTSVMLAEDDQHLYTYSKNIHEQLPQTIQLLQENPNTRRAIIYLTDAQHSQAQEHQPCLIAAYCSVRNKQLHLTLYARSIDLFIGFPANLYQAYTLAKKVSTELNKPLGSVSFVINSAHIFEDYQQELQQVIN